MKKFLPILINRYFLATVAFIVWVGFFDRHNLISQIKLSKELEAHENLKNFYLSEIEKDNEYTDALLGDVKKLEKFAREEYLMKRDNEDIFLIVEE